MRSAGVRWSSRRSTRPLCKPCFENLHILTANPAAPTATPPQHYSTRVRMLYWSSSCPLSRCPSIVNGSMMPSVPTIARSYAICVSSSPTRSSCNIWRRCTTASPSTGRLCNIWRIVCKAVHADWSAATASAGCATHAHTHTHPLAKCGVTQVNSFSFRSHRFLIRQLNVT